MTAVKADLPEVEMAMVLRNWALAREGATLSTNHASTGTDFSVDRAGTQDLGASFRSADLATALGSTIWLDVNFGRLRDVSWCSIHRHNVRVPWRIKIYPDTPGTSSPVFTSDWTDPIVRAELAEYSYQDLEYSLGPPIETIDALTDRYMLDSFIAADQIYRNVRYCRIEFDLSSYEDTMRHDHIQIGLPSPARVFRPRVNFSREWSIELIDDSELVRVNGALLGNRREVRRRVGFSINASQSRAETFDTLLGDAMARGKLGRVFVWPEPDHRRHFLRTAFMGTISSLPRSVMVYEDWPSSQGWQIEETF